MVAIVEIHRLLRRVRDVVRAPGVRTSRQQLRAIVEQQLEVEFRFTFSECKFGTLTLREVPDMLHRAGLTDGKLVLPDIEAVYSKNSVDVHKELDSRETLELLRLLIKTPATTSADRAQDRVNFLGCRIIPGSLRV